jgi:MoCo/4Fe-4S cofactor protein with predicted Tat translocation signal
MSAKEHDHDHDHSHPHSHDESAPQAPLPATPEHGYWKSIRELAGQAPWQLEPSTKEFAPGSDEPPPIDPMSRRNFFHLMGASMGLAGLAAGAGCHRYEKEEIVPLSRRPENQVPGATLEYATTFDLGGAAQALVATSYEGRPIHIDGNPDHPFAGGPAMPGTKRHAGTSTFAQASILHLYDPDRSQAPLNKGKASSIESFMAQLADVKAAIAAGGARVLSEASSSPTLQALKRRLEQAGVQWHEYEPLSWDNERDGTRLAFGRPVRPVAKLDRCETIVALDCDLFVEHPASLRYNRDFARSRRKDGSLGPGKMNRLWVAESVFSNTGAMADHRLGMRSELGLPFAMALDAALGGGGLPNSEFLKESKVAQFISVLAEELKANTGRAVVIAGRRQPAEVHALVAKINQAIGAVGATLDYHEDPDPGRPSHLKSITTLASDMNAGKVGTLIILGGNPVYDAPADVGGPGIDFATALAKVKTSIHLSEYADETSLKTTWHLPKAHFLEAWGDGRTWDGTISVAQPLIAPLYGGLSAVNLLAMLLSVDDKTGEKTVRETLTGLGAANWRKAVHDGFVANTALPTAQVSLQALPAPQLTPGQSAGSKRKNGELEVVYHFSSFTYDGRYANNPWLWETPDFLTKITWDNYALVGPETAQALGIKNDELITVKVGDKSIKLPCYVMPGQARYSIGLVLGAGRTASGKAGAVGGGRSGTNSPGWNTYAVRQANGFDFAINATVTGGGGTYTLANVQDHWNYKPGANKLMKNDRPGFSFDFEVEKRAHDFVEEVTTDDLEKKKDWKAEVQHEYWDDQIVADTEGRKARHLSLFEEREYHGHRWGMAIDLNVCTGCNACMVACQSENNVPTVGRKQVMNNREMHWIRIDRYFTGSPEEPHVVHQPLPCQQCENAPCEQVCPVAATVHSDEGLNDMAYNRCIGTRYCANNCPYRVRRFNFLDWNKEVRDAKNKVRRLLFNPDVTVRMRGVMEKCTFCVQRIQNGKIKAKAQIRSGQRAGAVGAPIPDGEIETACQMACPTEAIVFGDLEDPNSRVSRLHADRRSYALLPELYTKPRTRYLTRVLNPNPKMPPPPKAEGGH